MKPKSVCRDPGRISKATVFELVDSKTTQTSVNFLSSDSSSQDAGRARRHHRRPRRSLGLGLTGTLPVSAGTEDRPIGVGDRRPERKRRKLGPRTRRRPPIAVTGSIHVSSRTLT